MRLYRNPESNNDMFLEDLVERGVLPRSGSTYLESGAYDGVGGSSTFLLEMKYGWSGILVEPIRGMVRTIAEYRPKAKGLPVALSDRDDAEVQFVQVPGAYAGCSGIKARIDELREQAVREEWPRGDIWGHPGSLEYRVPTLTLDSLFQRYNGGIGVTVMCLDMEGSEFDALRVFDFDKYGPLVLTIEGIKCIELVLSKGYVKVKNRFNEIATWEHYFVRQPLYDAHRSTFVLA